MDQMTVSMPTAVRRHLDRANVSIVVGLVAAFAALVPVGPLAQCASVVGLIVLVGAVACARLDLTTASLTQRLSICLGFGFLGFLVVTAVIGAVFPHLGIARPLSRWPLVVSWCVLDAGIVAWLARTGDDPIRSTLRGCRPRDAAWAAALSIPPLLALVGVALLNASHGVVLADVVGVLVVAMTLAAVVLPDARWCPPRVLLLASALVTAAWQGTFRGGWLAGFDIQHEFYIGTLAINQAQFPLHHYVDPYGGMLSLTVWPAALHALSGITLRTTLGLVPTLFLALTLLVTWSVLRGRLGPRLTAALCALFVVGSSPLIQELPQVTRQCYAFFFFSLLVLAIVPGRLAPSTARAVAIASGVGLALTHYSSAYLAAGAVIVGCALTYLSRTPNSTRILTLPVSSAIIGAAALWGGFVARTGSSFSQIVNSIRADGLQLLPGTGSVVSRWLSGASVSQLVNANVIYNADTVLRTGKYHWMVVVPQALNEPLVNAPAPTSHGVAVLGTALSAGSTTVSQLLLLGALAATVFALWRCWRRDPALAGIAGVALFFVVAAGVSRFSQTIGVDFGPSRVEAQAYLIFVVVVGIALSTDAVAVHVHRVLATVQRRLLALVVIALAAVVAVMNSTGVAALVEVHQQLPAAYSSTGEQVQRLLVPSDLLAAQWVEANRPSRYLVQADRVGALALYAYGFTDRPNFITSVDPYIVDNQSWIFAYRTNVVLGTARGGNNARTGVFKFPASYFSSMRPTLYASGTDLVYGPIPALLAKGSS
jgi:hypothetical protein